MYKYHELEEIPMKGILFLIYLGYSSHGKKGLREEEIVFWRVWEAEAYLAICFSHNIYVAKFKLKPIELE